MKIPAGSRLIGTRTKGNKVIALCEFITAETTGIGAKTTDWLCS